MPEGSGTTNVFLELMDGTAGLGRGIADRG
jgi:hypothetical protein